MIDRRAFLTGTAGAVLGAAGCRGRERRGTLILRLSHSMATGPTSLNSFAERFRDRVEAATAGDVKVRLFPNGTLGQEREIVQQLQEGLVDFMVSGTAIWGSVAPRLQVLDFPFLWRDWDHVHRIVDGPVGDEAAEYQEAAVGVRPLAWGDSFGFRQVVTRSVDVTDARRLAGLKIRTIQSAIYVKAIELMGASPTPMAFGEVYTSLQTGVIDGYEHDSSTTLYQRFYEVARYMARTKHIAGVLGLFGSTIGLARVPNDIRRTIAQAAREAANDQREMGPKEDASATSALEGYGMTIREFDHRPFEPQAEQLWEREGAALGVTSWLKAIRA
jgi:tripartite ATP-independent transporter DctP family solute receptor